MILLEIVSAKNNKSDKVLMLKKIFLLQDYRILNFMQTV